MQTNKNISILHLKNFYHNCAAKPYSSLIIDATLASNNLLCFRKNLTERI